MSMAHRERERERETERKTKILLVEDHKQIF
jgi:hypothetical protein